MSAAQDSKVNLLAGFGVVMMALTFATMHSWLLQIITLGLGASAFLMAFIQLRQFRRAKTGRTQVLPVLAMVASDSFIFCLVVVWASSRPARYADYMSDSGAPVANGIALNSSIFQATSIGLLAFLPLLFHRCSERSGQSEDVSDARQLNK